MRRGLRGQLGDRYVLSWWWSARTDGEAPIDLRDELAAAALARRLTSTSEGLTAVRAMLAEAHAPIRRLDDADVVRALAAALRSGRLRVHHLASAPLSAIHRDAEDDAPQPTAEQSARGIKTWISIQLLGEDDRPIPGARYWIKLPDGAVREGRLDGQGYAYFGELDPGECEIRWPDLDSGAVAELRADEAPRALATGTPGGSSSTSTARAGGPPATAEKKTWVAIALVGEDDAPIAGEPYWIKLPGGAIREGRLDKDGRALFTDIDPGECEIRWPGLDADAVAPADPRPTSAGDARTGETA